ncbi:hypothetical protein [Nostoc sp.]|uniref:hypothetical protein n=1 Tax=Nostoc sp. TaxID=1180 RepID=UPI002FFD2F9C
MAKLSAPQRFPLRLKKLRISEMLYLGHNPADIYKGVDLNLGHQVNFFTEYFTK